MTLSQVGKQCGERQGGESSGQGCREAAGLTMEWPGETSVSSPPQENIESHWRMGDLVCRPSERRCRSALVEMAAMLRPVPGVLPNACAP